MTVFLIVYVLAGLLILAVELKAVHNDEKGDTITEMTRRTPVTMAMMGGLIVWAFLHFILGEWVGFTDISNSAAIVTGMILGALAWWYRRKKDSDDAA